MWCSSYASVRAGCAYIGVCFTIVAYQNNNALSVHQATARPPVLDRSVPPGARRLVHRTRSSSGRVTTSHLFGPASRTGLPVLFSGESWRCGWALSRAHKITLPSLRTVGSRVRAQASISSQIESFTFHQLLVVPRPRRPRPADAPGPLLLAGSAPCLQEGQASAGTPDPIQFHNPLTSVLG